MEYSEIAHPDRLRRMVALLERDAANPEGVMFDLSTWASPSDANTENPHGVWEKPVETIPVSCGTSACAMGLAAISGEFQAEGLGFEYMGGTRNYTIIPTLTENGVARGSGFLAAAHLFGITLGAAEYLFDPENYDECPVGAEGEKEVADRITAFLADGRYTIYDPRR